MSEPDPTDAAIDNLGILARRRIEAEILAPVYDELKAEIGVERAQEIIRKAVRRAAIAAGKAFADRAAGGTDIASFRAIQPLWTKDGALEIETLQATPESYDFNVRRCRYAETYKKMGLGEIGALLSCNRDGAFCEGYDSRLKLTRTQTIMEGASHCDFRYRLEEGSEPST
ncbi:MAG: L-2-amino-thiazoline-4-carboxylic acid hydrolase [Hyphomicrobiales bacterium]|nr:L-2-amino-thiazoline-4-carboxylic acid hydrolase [Hyphomicrobiales bacterium]